jgi:nucleoside-diphosphate-sugar epimerase
MRVLIIGAAGMLGGRLARRLACDGVLGGEAIDSILLVDVVAPAVPPGEVPVDTVVCDIADLGTMCDLLTVRPQVIVDLAAVVSGEAELDFEKGYRVNLDGTRHLLEAVRTAGEDYRPRVVFSSSIAVFGPPFPDVIGDEQATTPATSYGTQKAITELLLADYSRRGFLDGIGVRLPTICVRPGAPNRAASGFFSGIIREPLNGLQAALPVGRDVRHWFASPRAAVGFLVHAATIDTGALGSQRSLTMPGVSATVQEEIEALRRVAGDRAVALIRDEPDELIARVVGGWPRAFDARRAVALGFVADAGFDEIVRAYIEEELAGPTPDRAGGGSD